METTILSQGFVAAWASASSLVQKYSSSGPFEFIPVADMRDLFPALPLPKGSLIVAEPAASRVDAAFSASLSGLIDRLYTEQFRGMEAMLATLSGRQALKVRVQEGILHALFGRLPEAEAAFRVAIAEDPKMVSPYVNLANVRLLSSDEDGALLVVKQGLSWNAELRPAQPIGGTYLQRQGGHSKRLCVLRQGAEGGTGSGRPLCGPVACHGKRGAPTRGRTRKNACSDLE